MSEPLTLRIAKVLCASSASKRQAQFKKEEPKVDPSAKMLDKLYDAVVESDCADTALDLLFDLTKQLDLVEDVSFEVPVDEEEGDSTPTDDSDSAPEEKEAPQVPDFPSDDDHE